MIRSIFFKRIVEQYKKDIFPREKISANKIISDFLRDKVFTKKKIFSMKPIGRRAQLPTLK